MSRVSLLILTLIFACVGIGADDSSAAPVLVQRNGHGGAIRSVALSQSGELLASASEDNKIVIWNLASRQEVIQITSHVAPVAAVSFCGDKPFLVSASVDGTAALWDLKTLKEITNIGGPLVPSSIAASKDCRKVIVGNSHGPALLWKPLDGKKISILQGVVGAVSVAFSQDDHYLAAASDEGDIWRCDELTLSCEHATSDPNTLGVGFLPDNNAGSVWIATRSGLQVWSPKGNPHLVTEDCSFDAVSLQIVDQQMYAIDNGYLESINLQAIARPILKRLSENKLVGATSLVFSPGNSTVVIGNKSGDIVSVDLSAHARSTSLTGPRQALAAIAAKVDSMLFGLDDGPLWKMSLRRDDSSMIGNLLPSDHIVGFVNENKDALVQSNSGDSSLVELDTNHRWKLKLDSSAQKACDQHVVGFQMMRDGVLYVACRNGVLLKFLKEGAAFSGTAWLQSEQTGIRSVAALLADEGEDTMILIGSQLSDKEVRDAVFENILRAGPPPPLKLPCRAVVLGHPIGAVSTKQDFETPAPIIGAKLSALRKVVVLLDQMVGEDVAVPVKWGLILDMASGNTQLMEGRANGIVAATFSADARSVLTGSKDGRVRFWSTNNSTPVVERAAHTGPVEFLVAVPRSVYLLSAGVDGQIVLWDAAREQEIVRIIRPTEGDRLTISPGGQLDSSQLETLSSVGWVFPDDPYRPLPPEIFMRDYYEPRLLPRLLGCREAEARDAEACKKAFKPVGDLTKLNRIQADVQIIGVRQGASADEVIVKVEALDKEDKTQPNGKTYTKAYDLRLFRDGQLVGQWPEPKGSIGGPEELEGWKQVSAVPTPIHEFHVRLATRDAGRPVRFTAYAFNEDRVKSETSQPKEPYLAPKDMIKRQARAYVITVGVDGYQNRRRDLEFAVKDARDLSQALRQIKDYEVVQVSLLSEAPLGMHGKLDQATKRNVRAVLRVLGGHSEEQAQLHDVLKYEELKKATPDDLVILAFSGHGHTELNGSFYLLPSDSGQGDEIGPESLKDFISSEELSEWLREVDAGHMAIIIDACHSAASVETPGFKPGPMGDRGLGQLAYDKGMEILAASQADDVALEIESLHQGLLTYALREGLIAGKNGKLPAANPSEVTLQSWLKYAEQRVPSLYDDAKAGKVHMISRDPKPNPNFLTEATKHAQIPSLFDFSKQNFQVQLK